VLLSGVSTLSSLSGKPDNAGKARSNHQGLGFGILPAGIGRMMTFVCVVVAFVAAGVLTEIVAASAAPFGYQDNTGFHFGRPVTTQATGDFENPS
jgi:hypothetical protein